MAQSKRRGAIGIAREATHGTPIAAATYVLPVDSANIEATPVTYERVNSIDADPIGIEQSGFEYSWNFSGAELSIEEVGWLLWLYLGEEVNTTGSHLITPVYNSQSFTFFKDMGVSYDGTNPTLQLAGCRIDTMTLEQPHKGYAKISASGTGMSALKLTSSLSRTPTYTGMGYHNLINPAGGGIGYGISESDPTALALTVANSCKIELNRETSRAGRKYSSNNPSSIVEGGRTLSWEITADTQTDTPLNALVSSADGALRIRAMFKWNDAGNSQSLVIDIPTAQITNSYAGEVGAGSDVQVTTFMGQAFRASSNDLITATCVDGISNNYEDRVGA